MKRCEFRYFYCVFYDGDGMTSPPPALLLFVRFLRYLQDLNGQAQDFIEVLRQLIFILRFVAELPETLKLLGDAEKAKVTHTSHTPLTPLIPSPRPSDQEGHGQGQNESD